MQPSIQEFFHPCKKTKPEKLDRKGADDNGTSCTKGPGSKGTNHTEQSKSENKIEYIGHRTREEAIAAKRVLDPAVEAHLQVFDWWLWAKDLDLDPPADLYPILQEIDEDEGHPWRVSQVTHFVMQSKV
ncbi:hypothetical protein BT96DRAFT_1064937 [Gymnopus androsaceus JB14]|uniref:Uncharacterized protein n=1 Tax=Gymnopus androsaceus JB14 TaxID=1447944 RepID=A0A6A4I0P1_9AGAR|nr:hypothetical protein BT96DRAFT_1064937 [Gymnopus androsaceus JB14]